MLNTPWCSKPRLTLLLYGVLLLQFAFLHVKGKSGLKHTPQLLECWRGRPDLPTLTVTGRFSWNEVKESVNAPNIVLYPKVGSLGRFLLAAGFEWFSHSFPALFWLGCLEQQIQHKMFSIPVGGTASLVITSNQQNFC
jgi:hypothetical protein